MGHRSTTDATSGSVQGFVIPSPPSHLDYITGGDPRVWSVYLFSRGSLSQGDSTGQRTEKRKWLLYRAVKVQKRQPPEDRRALKCKGSRVATPALWGTVLAGFHVKGHLPQGL